MRRIFLAGLGLAVISLPLHAETSNPPGRKWANKADLSLVSTNGNSKGTTTSVKDLFTWKWSELTGLQLEGAALGSDQGNKVTAENYMAREKIAWKLVGENYVFEQVRWDKDRFAGIRNRYDSSVGLGRRLLDLAKDKLNAELGGGYVNEERTEAPRNDYGSGRAYMKYSHNFTDASSFTQDAEYIHNFKDSKGYRLNTESALIAAISTNLSLKTSFVWKRNGLPPPGAAKDDTITSTALVVNF